MTIDSEDTATFSVAPLTVSEDVGTANVVLTLTAPSSQDVSGTFLTVIGTATIADDYTAVSGRAFTISSGDLTVNLPVAVADDDIVEAPETFQVEATLTGGTAGISASDDTGRVTVTDNDTSALSLSVEPASPIADRDFVVTGALDKNIRLPAGGSITYSDTSAIGAPDLTFTDNINGSDSSASDGRLTGAELTATAASHSHSAAGDFTLNYALNPADQHGHCLLYTS
ncbi:MAG: hypothetical protein MPK62_15380, partial [Alphaproteobacteria bacterium]|nr:hypothetical protein [Alphaproteobacteria bacterium]